MQIDTERWQRLRAAAADAEHDGPSFVDVQAANGRWALARDQLARLKAEGPTGNVSRPMARARASETIRPGMGGHGADDLARAFENSVRELERHAGEAEREAKRLTDRLRACGERRNTLQRLIEQVRKWAAEQSVVLPGD